MVTTRAQLSDLERAELIKKFSQFDSERARKRIHKLIDPKNEEPSSAIRWSSRPSNRFSMFIVFNKQHRQRISQEYPELTNQEISSKVSQAYRDLSPEEKEKLRQQCAQMREEARQANTQPALPPSGFIMFGMDKRPEFKELYPKASFAELNQMVATLWWASDPKVRKKYQERSRRARQKFKAQHSMTSEGDECGVHENGLDRTVIQNDTHENSTA